MSIKGEVTFNVKPVMYPIMAMQTQTEMLAIANDNINGFDKIGFQAKKPVLSSFAEYIGPKALSTAVDDSVGRIGYTGNPLDLALEEKGYFQILTPNGVQLTRDGRLKYTKDGVLLSLEGYPILSNNGDKIILPLLPESVDDIKIDLDGKVSVLDRDLKKLVTAGTISTVTQDGVGILHPKVRQNYLEFSNVDITSEFIQAAPYMRNFKLNKQMFTLVNASMRNVISTLGQV